MLMFTRKKDESFVIDTGSGLIKIIVADFGKGAKMVQLGVDAPREFKVWRSEIFEAIEENKKAALSQNVKPNALKKMISK